MDYLEREYQLLQLAVGGIGTLTQAGQLVEALAAHRDLVREYEGTKLGDETREETEQELEKARALARLAQQEVDDGFPLLYAHAAVAAWAGLETTIVDLAVAWLSNQSQALESEELKSIRLPLATFLSLDHEERIRLLAAEMERQAGASLGSGASRFERLLNAIGLSGWVPEDVRRELFELQQVRNVVVHRAGLADRRFVENCRSWNLGIGDRVTVDHDKCGLFFAAVLWYALVVRHRVMAAFGVPAEPPMPDLPLSNGAASNVPQGDEPQSASQEREPCA